MIKNHLVSISFGSPDRAEIDERITDGWDSARVSFIAGVPAPALVMQDVPHDKRSVFVIQSCLYERLRKVSGIVSQMLLTKG